MPNILGLMQLQHTYLIMHTHVYKSLILKNIKTRNSPEKRMGAVQDSFSTIENLATEVCPVSKVVIFFSEQTAQSRELTLRLPSHPQQNP